MPEEKEPDRWLIKCSLKFADFFFPAWGRTNYDKSKAEEVDRYSRSPFFWRNTRENT